MSTTDWKEGSPFNYELCILQEAGWLTGVREVDWQPNKDTVMRKGLFPENFTRKLE